jgi:PHD/YefM family antitoxin component YafN of YafNO toxin-antitoxin module
MSSNDHQTRTYDVSLIASNLVSLHEFVTRTNGRIEVTRPGSDERCVLIGKQELASLERALEILSDTDDVRDLRGKIAELAAATGPLVAADA